jgi:prostaglandin-endoperoxide synthase 2
MTRKEQPAMANILEDLALKALSAIVGASEVNEFLIDKLVDAGRNRPHPFSTRNDYISWSGLTDRSYNARLLPAKPYPAAEALGTRRPPVDDVVRLFAAAPTGQRVCPKSTLLFPAFAQYLTDGFIRTQVSNDPPFGSGKEDRRRTTSNHEIDQSPLYGRTEAQTRALRLLSEAAGKRGRLKSQVINGAEFPPFLFDAGGKVLPEWLGPDGQPLIDLPLGIDHLPPGAPQWASLFAVGGDRVNATPQVSMLNVLFLREHNRLAAMLEANNPGWDDERVFQIARNILIVMFITIVVEEYINHINTSVFRFVADGRVAWKAKWNRPNWMTAEFSLLYRWHSLMPQRIDWPTGGQVQRVESSSLGFDNRALIDHGLADAFVNISANNATELGLGNSAPFLVGVEKKAILQARTNNLASYNDYREAMDMKRARDFTDIVGKSDDAVEQARRKALAAELKRLYGTVDNVEYYVGLFAEPTETNGPLPDLIMAMVAMDAFSQALTNPLLSEHVWGDKDNRLLAFTAEGLAEIAATKRLKDVLVRNSSGVRDRFVGMTRRDWRRG